MGEIRELFHGEPREYKPRNEMAVRMERSAGITLQNFADDLAGFVVIGVNGKGEWSLGFGVDQTSALGPTMLAGLAMAAIQRDIVADGACRDSLIRNNLVLPDPEQK